MHNRRPAVVLTEEDLFPSTGVPGPLGKELLRKLAVRELGTDKPAAVEDLFGGQRPKWAVAAMARILLAGWIRCPRPATRPDQFVLTGTGWKLAKLKRPEAV